MRCKKGDVPCNQDSAHQWSGTVVYSSPPTGETAFVGLGNSYLREYRICDLCNHWLSFHDLDLTQLYSGNYVHATYGERLRETFKRITNLPPEKSDNYHRVENVNTTWNQRWPHHPRKILDVGSGLGVFPKRMKESGWNTFVVDPDPTQYRHLHQELELTGWLGDFLSVNFGFEKFSLITFNKVLEHVPSPTEFLIKSRELLHPDGVVYIEVPDAETAICDPLGKNREEFFVDHIHVFSFRSLSNLLQSCGFQIIKQERLQEKSSKYTLRTFAQVLGKTW